MPDSPKTRIHDALSRLVGRPAFWLALVLGMASWPAVWSVRTRLPAPLPVLATLPTFDLTDQEGRRFGSRDLAGKVWVASFIYTRCATICPAITAKMAQIQARTGGLAPALHLVSFSVDPDYDTPERLAAYARLHHASPRRWSFLTGPEDEVRDAVVGGLKVTMEKERREDGRLEGIFHGSHLVLVDGSGRVRHYYDSDEARVVDDVVRDAALLLNRGN